jgi:hypothetical protein
MDLPNAKAKGVFYLEETVLEMSPVGAGMVQQPMGGVGMALLQTGAVGPLQSQVEVEGYLSRLQSKGCHQRRVPSCIIMHRAEEF